MTSDDKNDMLDQIATADIGQLRQIIMRLDGMEQTPDVLELIDVAEENVDSLVGNFSDD